MRMLWQRSLAARFICLMLLALAISQGAGFVLSRDERDQALRMAVKEEFLSRTASLAKVLEATPVGQEHQILRATDTADTRFWVSLDEPRDPRSWQEEARANHERPLPSLKPHGERAPDSPASQAGGGQEWWKLGLVPAARAQADLSWRVLPSHAWPLSRPAKFLYTQDPVGIGMSVRLSNGAWLSAICTKPLFHPGWTMQSSISLAVAALVLSGVAIYVTRGIARPMRRLAQAAEALGRGEEVARLPEQGPDDIRQTAVAFNRMQERLQRFVEDRTRMLAAIGHDLRTPITTLRLRAEFVPDRETQEKMLATLDEMQGMTEAALSFARDEAGSEQTRAVELGALVESLCDDLSELGARVEYEDGFKGSYRCRPDALRRALRNLIENAVRYGSEARVRVVREKDSLDIVVSDKGPGIREADMAQVFAPFFRLEHSRNAETGGVGLGLSIARAIARHHGGDVVLRNIAGGLEARITLPLIDRVARRMPLVAQVQRKNAEGGAGRAIAGSA